MYTRYLCVILSILLGCYVFANNKISDVNLIRDRIILDTYYNVDLNSVSNILNSIKDDGTWTDINYVDVSHTGFQHEKHLKRMLELANAYRNKNSRYNGDKKILSAFEKAMWYWLKHDFKCDNWWYNEIGTPSIFISILLIMDEALSEEQLNGMLSIASRANLDAWGARPSGDRIKIASLQAKTEIFKKDIKKFEYVLGVLKGEMKFADSKSCGLQYDYSFHHRFDRVNNTLTYGLDFIDIYAEWLDYTAKTIFQFSDDSIKLAIDYYLDGVCKQMVYGRVQDTGIQNRDITRPVNGDGIFSPITLERFANVIDYRRDEINNIIKSRKGESFIPESFSRFFWQSEHFVVQRPNFYTSIRMYSRRNMNMEEAYNGEGLKNHFRADGSNYLSIKGNEYLNISPVYDWNMIPGTTTLILDEMPKSSEVQKKGYSEFVGAVTDGLYGAVGFDFKSSHYPLKAKKSWFFFSDKYVCLGTGIESESDKEIVTTISQSYLSGNVSYRDQYVKNISRNQENYFLDSLKWIKHGNIGYILLENSSIGVYVGEKKGNWFSVNCQSKIPKEEVRKDVFKLWLRHGNGNKGKSYAYIVLPEVNKKVLDNQSKNPSVRVIYNNPQMQVVDNKEEGILYAVMYDNGMTLKHDIIGDVELKSSGILMVKYSDKGNIEYIAYSDPTRKLDKVNISITGEHRPILNEKLEYSFNKNNNVTSIVASLPLGEFRGKSIKISFGSI